MEKVSDAQVRQATVFNDQAIQLWQKEKKNEAIELWELAVEKAPKVAETLHNLGSAYLYLDRIEDALRCFQEATENDPELVEAYAKIGNIYQQKGDIPTANEYWNRALQIDPSCQEAITNLEQFNTNRYDPENIPEYETPDNNLSSSNKDSSLITSSNLTLGQKLVGGISTLLGREKNTKR